MPAGDRTGPRGEGPRTGRGLGFCSGYRTPGYTKGVPRGGGGFGRGRGFGFGRGFSRRFGYSRGYVPSAPAPGDYARETGYANQEAQSEKEYLEREVEALENELEAMRRRMKELNEEGTPKE
ncbi:MAG: DUF5320 domain-containing protein [Candidatus Bipolaricaulota bacterium]